MNITALEHLVPADGALPDWQEVLSTLPCLIPLATTPQDPFYHAEGDVWTHTKMVVEALLELPAYRTADSARKFRLFIGALLHDVAKPACTREENGRLTSKGHSRRGSVDARILLWRAGVPFADREAICRLISYHQAPFVALSKHPRPEYTVRKLSWELDLVELVTLAEADARGRRTVPASDWQDTLDNVALFRELAAEESCLGKPRAMADRHTALKYFRSGGEMPCDWPMHQNGGSKVIVLSGLPATGKDTWLVKNCPNLPVVSFDDAREELGLKYGENDGAAAHYAVDKAKALLRAKEPFAWCSTNLSAQMREKTLSLLYAYDAEVSIVYLEENETTLLTRNSKRDTTLTNKKLQEMLFKWEVPLPTEAHGVQYFPAYL